MLGQTPTLTQRQLAPGWPSICISIKARSGLTTRPTRIHTSTSSPVATLAPPRLRSTRILFPSLLSTPRTFYRSLSTRASVKDSPAVVSPPAAPAPPALAPDQAQLLTELHVGDVYALGVPGVDSPAALATALDTDLSSGLDGTDADSLAARAARYGTNAVAAPPSASFWELFIEALDDFTVRILLGAGVASLGLEFWIAGQEGSQPSLIEPLSILAAVAVVTFVTAGNNYQKEQQFKALQEVTAEETVRAVRNGREVQLRSSSVLVGDLLLVETGDILCADGVLVAGADIKVDESHLTGEADDVSKDPTSAQALYGGSKVVSGFGKMLVTAVGQRSQSGSIASMIAAAAGGQEGATLETGALTLPTEGLGRLREETALQRKLAGYAATIGQVGLGAAVLATVALAGRFTYDTFLLAHLPWDWAYLHAYLNFFITGVTILVVAIPEGLPLAVTISLAYSVMKMLEQNNLVRHLGAAETMATATAICTDKTGTLTQNRMAVTKLWVAGQSIAEVGVYMTAMEPRPVLASGSFASLSGSMESLISIDDSKDDLALWTRTFDEEEAWGRLACPELQAALGDAVAPGVLRLLCQGISLNSTANVTVDRRGGLQESGNRTEIALLQLVQALGQERRCECEAATPVLAQAPFTSERKRMATVVALPRDEAESDLLLQGVSSGSSDGAAASTSADNGTGDANGRVFVKGAAEIVLDLCAWRLGPSGARVPLTSADRTALLSSFEGEGLRLLALAYRDVKLPETGLGGLASDAEDTVGASSAAAAAVVAPGVVESLEQDLILVSVVGLQDPLRPEAAAAIATCQNAGISVKMLTGDNAGTAAQIASQCGILPSARPKDLEKYAVMEGGEFRELIVAPDGGVNAAAFRDVWPRLKVLARCTPADKFTIVTAVRSLTKDRVAMTGDGTNDAPALRAADVGFAMASGTQVAKDAADIVLLDDNFSSIVVAALWGRNVYASVSRFLQFQLTVNAVAVVLAVGGALGAAESPLSAVQMLWVNLIMDSLASLALATEAPDPALLRLPPFTEDYQFLDPRGPMLKHVVGQAVYQLSALTWMLVAAPAALGIDPHIPGAGPSLHHTLIFNAFVQMQLFNQVNARCIGDEGDVARGLSTAGLFLGVLGAEAVLQAAIVEWGGAAFSTVPLAPEHWALCLGLGAGSLLVREVVRRVPHEALADALLGPAESSAEK